MRFNRHRFVVLINNVEVKLRKKWHENRGTVEKIPKWIFHFDRAVWAVCALHIHAPGAVCWRIKKRNITKSKHRIYDMRLFYSDTCTYLSGLSVFGNAWHGFFSRWARVRELCSHRNKTVNVKFVKVASTWQYKIINWFQRLNICPRLQCVYLFFHRTILLPVIMLALIKTGWMNSEHSLSMCIQPALPFSLPPCLPFSMFSIYCIKNLYGITSDMEIRMNGPIEHTKY